jgi:hypothetical protein
MIGHGGDTTLFHSKLVLIPEKQTGFIVMYNSPGGGSARDEVFEKFMDHYYPEKAVALPEHGPADVSRLQKYAGTYEINRRSFTRFEKYQSQNSQNEVTVAPDGTLKMSRKGYCRCRRWRLCTGRRDAPRDGKSRLPHRA